MSGNAREGDFAEQSTPGIEAAQRKRAVWVRDDDPLTPRRIAVKGVRAVLRARGPGKKDETGDRQEF